MKPKTKITEAEQEMEQDFEVLCFLYDLYSLRCRVKDIWNDWMQQKIGTMTAALASDLAMSRVYQRATVLHESLNENKKKRTIVRVIEKWRKLAPTTGDATFPSGKEELSAYPDDILCHDAIRLMDKFWSLRPEGIRKAQNLSSKESFCLRFLAHFKLVDQDELRVAAGLPLDKFTESISSPEAQSEAWLPFGFQILLDIQETLTVQMKNIQWDVIDHATHVGGSIQEHLTYEDEVWDTEDKPDYMTVGRTKWATRYLPIASRLIDWAQKLLNITPEEVSGMTNAYFLAVHPILSGRTMWDYHRTFHCAAIIKVQWFTVALAHLYNACRQVGGLDVPWPDLDFIIECQGSARVYIGGPPTDPNLFYKRLALALCGSSAEYAKDRRGGGYINISSEAKAKRGLADYFPLEEKIAKYFESTSRSDRSSRLHNLFASLLNERKKSTEVSPGTAASKISKIPDKARSIFEAIASKRARGSKNKKGRKKNKSRVPDFSNVDSVHAELLGDIVSQLTEHEVYSNFDHLSFFRRAITIVNHVRKEILWDDSKAVATLDAVQEPPNDFDLLYSLFCSLKPPRDKTQKKQADIFQDGMEKIEKVSDVIRAFVAEQGDAEKKNAEEQTRRRRQHDTLLSAVYSSQVKATPVSFKDLPSARPKFNAQPNYNFGQTFARFGSTASSSGGGQEPHLKTIDPQTSDSHDYIAIPVRSMATQTEDEPEESSDVEVATQIAGRTILVPKGRLRARAHQDPCEDKVQGPPSWLLEPDPGTVLDNDTMSDENTVSDNDCVLPPPYVPSPESLGTGVAATPGEKRYLTEAEELELILPGESTGSEFENANTGLEAPSEPSEPKLDETAPGETLGSDLTEDSVTGQEEITAEPQEEVETFDSVPAKPGTATSAAEAPDHQSPRAQTEIRQQEAPDEESQDHVVEQTEGVAGAAESDPVVSVSSQAHEAQEDDYEETHIESPAEKDSTPINTPKVQEDQDDTNSEVQMDAPVEKDTSLLDISEVRDNQDDTKEESEAKGSGSEPNVHHPPEGHANQEDHQEEVQEKDSTRRECSWNFVKYIFGTLFALERAVTGRGSDVPAQEADDVEPAVENIAPQSPEDAKIGKQFASEKKAALPAMERQFPPKPTSHHQDYTKHGTEVVSFGVYHRMAYPSRRPSRHMQHRSYVPQERDDKSTKSKSRHRHARLFSAGVKKRTICHVCHGRCLIGKALLKDEYDTFWDMFRRPEVGGEDGWETDDEEDEV